MGLFVYYIDYFVQGLITKRIAKLCQVTDLPTTGSTYLVKYVLSWLGYICFYTDLHNLHLTETLQHTANPLSPFRMESIVQDMMAGMQISKPEATATDSQVEGNKCFTTEEKISAPLKKSSRKSKNKK